jgi:hypothetical protein
VRERTGIEVVVTGVVGDIQRPKHVIASDNGEVRRQFALYVRADRGADTPGSGGP